MIFYNFKKVDISSLNNKKSNKFIIPSFSELRELAMRYEIFVDSDDPFDSDVSKYKIREIKTGIIQTDKSIIDKAMFANIWLTSAGVKYYADDMRPGEKYAFNEKAKETYEIICNELIKSCNSSGGIDTVGLFRDIEKLVDYKYNRDIVVSMFRTPYQAKLINSYFLSSLGINQQSLKAPEALYTMTYAYGVMSGNRKF